MRLRSVTTLLLFFTTQHALAAASAGLVSPYPAGAADWQIALTPMQGAPMLTLSYRQHPDGAWVAHAHNTALVSQAFQAGSQIRLLSQRVDGQRLALSFQLNASYSPQAYKQVELVFSLSTPALPLTHYLSTSFRDGASSSLSVDYVAQAATRCHRPAEGQTQCKPEALEPQTTPPGFLDMPAPFDFAPQLLHVNRYTSPAPARAY